MPIPKISLADLHYLISQSRAVLIEGALARVALVPLTGLSDNEWLQLTWRAGDQEFSVIATEASSQDVSLADGVATFEDHEGDPVELTILVAAGSRELRDGPSNGLALTAVMSRLQGVPSAALDGLVHDAASRAAAVVNNGGRGDQVRYLLAEGFTPEEILAPAGHHLFS